MRQFIFFIFCLCTWTTESFAQASAVSQAPSRRTRVYKRGHADFAKVVQIARLATSSLSRQNSRVVFASEASLQSMHLERWIVTVEPYPEHYRVSKAIFSGPPCTDPLTIKEVCSIQQIPGEPLFRGEFDVDPSLYRFAGSVSGSAHKYLAFYAQMKKHPEWTQAQVSAALASAGAKYGPDKRKGFLAALPLKALEKTFGRMRVKNVTSIKASEGWGTYWRVRTAFLKRPKVGLIMYFEPFEGQLQLLYFTGPYRVWDPVTKKFKWVVPKD